MSNAKISDFIYKTQYQIRILKNPEINALLVTGHEFSRTFPITSKKLQACIVQSEV